ncbi:MAG TPA: polyprenyl synthetase family protein [Actinomycetota bacterium]|nr:polyprenyl synthetase family protein [Actinomycetota bacterium]
MSDFRPTHPELRARIDARLFEVLARRREHVPEAAPLVAEIERVVGAGGKRLRPAFCYWGHRCAGGRDGPEIVDAAASLELLHTFAIVHDDIMDAAHERRGVPTVNAVSGVNVALLVGDLALVLADDLFMHCGFAPQVVADGFDCYSRMRQEVIAGQFLDLVVSERAEVSEDETRRIAVLKSGRYSVEEPLFIGAALAGAGDDLLEPLARFAAPLGEAFQMRDDLLGTFGSAAATGKPVDSDIRQGKRNILYAKTLHGLRESDRTFFAGRWGDGEHLSAEDVERLRELIESSGARAATESLLDELQGQVEAALDELPVDADCRAALDELGRVAIERES